MEKKGIYRHVGTERHKFALLHKQTDPDQMVLKNHKGEIKFYSRKELASYKLADKTYYCVYCKYAVKSKYDMKLHLLRDSHKVNKQLAMLRAEIKQKPKPKNTKTKSNLPEIKELLPY